jgi:hypothetical protein
MCFYPQYIEMNARMYEPPLPPHERADSLVGVYVHYVLESHIRNVVRGLKNFKCIYANCEERFFTEFELNQHVEKTHLASIEAKFFSYPKRSKLVETHTADQYDDVDHDHRGHDMDVDVAESPRLNKSSEPAPPTALPLGDSQDHDVPSLANSNASATENKGSDRMDVDGSLPCGFSRVFSELLLIFLFCTIQHQIPLHPSELLNQSNKPRSRKISRRPSFTRCRVSTRTVLPLSAARMLAWTGGGMSNPDILASMRTRAWIVALACTALTAATGEDSATVSSRQPREEEVDRGSTREAARLLLSRPISSVLMVSR